jgi:NAD(P)-dependent dehydrogenase (short-subunit alcohol dehydrogenase family)
MGRANVRQSGAIMDALAGKAIIVTGAGRGIGRAIALEAAKAGASLLLTDRDEDVLQGAAGDCGAEWVVADLMDVSAPEIIAAMALDKFGRIDGLVNAAGLTTRGSFVTGTAALWDALFAVNARAGFLLMSEAIGDMLARKSPGTIVNILSMNAHVGTPELAIYAASKGAMQTLTKNAAQAHMADRIRVNGINLGWVATETEHRMQAEVLGKGEGWQAKAAADLPLGRLLKPDEVARLAVFLLSPASAPMSGAVIDFEQKVAGAI